jgi:Flp pilus assembly CpaE family ATPase
VVVAEPALLDARPPVGSLLALATRESVASLRAALRAGASGYFVWPSEREDLIGAAAAALREARRPAGRATVIAVHGGRGGVGTTFVSTGLAAALARRGSVILLDADPVFADVARVLASPPIDEVDAAPVHTLADVVALGDDLGADELRGALWRHDSGVEVVLPPAPEQAASIGATEVGRVLDAAAGAADAVVVHLPRALGAVTSACASVADRVIEVVTLDVASFRAASRTVEALAPLHLGDRLAFVVNRAVRSEITSTDVQRVFGTPAAAVLPVERGVRSAQDRGQLPTRGRLARRFDRLAQALVPEPSEVGPET